MFLEQKVPVPKRTKMHFTELGVAAAGCRIFYGAQFKGLIFDSHHGKLGVRGTFVLTKEVELAPNAPSWLPRFRLWSAKHETFGCIRGDNGSTPTSLFDAMSTAALKERMLFESGALSHVFGGAYRELDEHLDRLAALHSAARQTVKIVAVA